MQDDSSRITAVYDRLLDLYIELDDVTGVDIDIVNEKIEDTLQDLYALGETHEEIDTWLAQHLGWDESEWTDLPSTYILDQLEDDDLDEVPF